MEIIGDWSNLIKNEIFFMSVFWKLIICFNFVLFRIVFIIWDVMSSWGVLIN